MTRLPLIDEDDLAVLDDDEGGWAHTSATGAPPLDDADRAALCQSLIADHRFDAVLADALCTSLVAAPAVDPWPEAAGVVALAESAARRFALDRSAALCVAVAVTRRLRRRGLMVVGLRD